MSNLSPSTSPNSRGSVADLGDHPAMILRHHGLLTVDETCAQAFLRVRRAHRPLTTARTSRSSPGDGGMDQFTKHRRRPSDTPRPTTHLTNGHAARTSSSPGRRGLLPAVASPVIDRSHTARSVHLALTAATALRSPYRCHAPADQLHGPRILADAAGLSPS
ncbi:class II aldolase/adducin family protein [Streptomyces sviceus]|uniref:class II aldolase/adducin family protein n=1 Tax=Streptomyces TaxID=1883 RepID=UPI003145383C